MPPRDRRRDHRNRSPTKPASTSLQFWLWAKTGALGARPPLASPPVRWRRSAGTMQPAKAGLTGRLPRLVQRAIRRLLGVARAAIDLPTQCPHQAFWNRPETKLSD